MSLTNEQLTNINKTLLKQRDDAELKVKQLVTIIEDELWPDDARLEKLAIEQLKKIGV